MIGHASDGSATGRAAPRISWIRITVESLLVVAAATLLAIIFTWPLATHFSTDILGGSGTPSDPNGYWWDIWENSQHGLDLWGTAIQNSIGFPFGRPYVGSGNLTLLVTTGPAWLLAQVMTPAAAMNLIAIAGLALSGASMYMLIRWLRLGIAVAAWAGLAFELSPYIFFRASAHLPFTHMEWAPILLMAAIAWVMKPSAIRAVLLAAATAFGWLSTPYYGPMASLIAGVAVIVGLIVFLIRREPSRRIATHVGQAVGSLIVLVGIPVIAMILSSRGATAAVTRQRVELELYGARIWDYLVPPPGSNLIEGIIGPGGLDPVRSPGGERAVFLGWVVIALALAGIVLAVRHRERLTAWTRISLAVALPSAVVLGLFSMASPTRILGAEIPMPSSLVFSYLPYLRAYARFGSGVLVTTIVVAAIGLALIVWGRSQLVRYCWIAGAVVLTLVGMPIAFTLPSGPPLLIAGRSPDAVPTWAWLRGREVGAAVMEAPGFSTESLDRTYQSGQVVHGHPLANGGRNEANAASDFQAAYGDPRLPGAATAYATAGVRLVALEAWSYAEQQIPMPDVAKPPAGFSVVKRFSDGSAIWRVTSKDVGAVAFPKRPNWWAPETINGERWRYMRDSAAMRAWASRAGKYQISFGVRGFNPQRTYRLSVLGPDSVAHTFAVTGYRQVRFTTTLPAGSSEFLLTNEPRTPPVQISAADPRIVSMQVGPWTLSPRTT